MTKTEKYLQGLSDWMQLRNYSKATISAYGCALKQFLAWRDSAGYEGPFGMSEARQYILHPYRNGSKWQTVNGDD